MKFIKVSCLIAQAQCFTNWGDYHIHKTLHIVGFHMTSLKFKLKKLSILPRFYFHDALEQLKTNFHTNFCFKRVLGFVIEYA